jgi:DNA polymerase
MENLKKLKELYILKSLGVKYIDNYDLNRHDIDIKHLPNSLEYLKKMVNNCHLCELSKTRQNIIFSDGNTQADIMFIGDTPLMYDEQEGVPFIGHAGDTLNKMIENVLLIKREDTYITNIIKCRPPQDRIVTQKEIDSCKEYIFQQIKLVKPKIIVTLGGDSYKSLTGDKTQLSKIRGHIIDFKGIKLVPTYHPKFLIRNPSFKKDAFTDMKLIKKLLMDIE